MSAKQDNKVKDDLCRTVSRLSKDGWNQSMKKTFEDITAVDKKEEEKVVIFSTAVLIVQSLDKRSGKSCLKQEDLQKLLPYIIEGEKQLKKYAQEASGVDGGQMSASSTHGSDPKSAILPGKDNLSITLSTLPKSCWNTSMENTWKNIAYADKKEAEKLTKFITAVVIVKSIHPSSGKSCIEPDNLRQLLQYFIEGEKPKEPVQESSPSSAVSRSSQSQPIQSQTYTATKDTKESRGADKRPLGPENSSGSPVQAKKTDNKQEKTSEVTTPVGKSDPHKRTDLSEKRAQELKEKDEEYEELSRKIEMKDKRLQELEGEVKKLKNDNKMVEISLNKIKTEKDERQCVINDLEGKLERLNYENTGLTSKINELLAENRKLTAEKANLEGNFEKLKKCMEKVSRDSQRKLDELIEDSEKEVRSLNNKLSEVIKDRDDLKTRFSKLAGAKLTDQNADIADLSDPNRAMKVSEKFGQMYDDEWTDAFEDLKKKKMDGKDAIQLLLQILQDCHTFCNKLKEAQIDSLNNVLLHPSQDVTNFAKEHRKNVGGLKEKARISSKDEKSVRNLRRQIGVSSTCIEEVKQVFVLETKSWVERGYDKKHLEVCQPYLEKCAEVCWLMVLHDPPLYMKMDALHGDKMDPNLYTVYSTSGDKIDYLVWPPLYNEAGGGLISKGVAECLKTIKKK